ncbi:MAG: P1 family peptidase [Bacteroidota bacterium]
MKNFSCAIVVALLSVAPVLGQDDKRARDLGIPFNGSTGEYNNITDVPGVEVGYKTLIEGEGKLIEGKGPIRTGVTIIIPAGKEDRKAIPAGIFSFNGDGELTGSHFIEDYGFLPGAIIGITNTNSVGVVRDAIGEWQIQHFPKPPYDDFRFGLPVVGETYDGDFNDINGLHVTKAHVFEAIDASKSGSIAEGNVGGGTGMWLYGFKGGTGSSSRVVSIGTEKYTVGVLVQANFGHREDLMVAGVPVGKRITDLQPVFNKPKQDGSIIVIVATDAPILPIHLKQVAKRATNGIARTGAFGGNGSGDIFLAFSTAQPTFTSDFTRVNLSVLAKWSLDPIYKATVEATEEAIINALVAAKTMEGANGNIMYECPEDRLMELMKEFHGTKD